jgi:hypothetical protein
MAEIAQVTRKFGLRLTDAEWITCGGKHDTQFGLIPTQLKIVLRGTIRS